jgi:heat shock protein HtpX
MRILLYVLTNLAVVLLLGVVLRVFGLEDWLYQHGIPMDLARLLVFAAAFGFLGSFVSLAMSKSIAKWTTGAKVITDPRSTRETWLVNTVRRLATQAGIGMPEVAIFPSGDPNAFATGMRRNASLVAVSEGLLQSMDEREVEAVLAHEVSHVANGDMITMSLLQGVLNTFVIFLSRVVGTIVDGAMGNRDRGRGIGYWVTVMALEVVFGILASILVMTFSRWREYRADAGAAAMVGAPAMISALDKLGRMQHPSELPDQLAAFGIHGRRKGGLAGLFRSHPPIPERIAALQRFRR